MNRQALLRKVANRTIATAAARMLIKSAADPGQSNDPAKTGVLNSGQVVAKPVASYRYIHPNGRVSARSMFKGNVYRPAQYLSGKFVYKPKPGGFDQKALERNRDLTAKGLAEDFGIEEGTPAFEELKSYVHQRGRENVASHFSGNEPARGKFQFKHIDPGTQRDLAEYDDTIASRRPASGGAATPNYMYNGGGAALPS